MVNVRALLSVGMVELDVNSRPSTMEEEKENSWLSDNQQSIVIGVVAGLMVQVVI